MKDHSGHFELAWRQPAPIQAQLDHLLGSMDLAITSGFRNISSFYVIIDELPSAWSKMGYDLVARDTTIPRVITNG